MARSSLSGMVEVLGAVLVVVGLAFLSLPIAVILTGVFLIVAANAPGGRPPRLPPGVDGRRASEAIP